MLNTDTVFGSATVTLKSSSGMNSSQLHYADKIGKNNMLSLLRSPGEY